VSAMDTDSRQLCTFVVAGRHFGVEVSKMREVLKAQTLTRVPLAPKQVRGLINLRGQIVTAIDLRERLGMPPGNDAPASMNVIVQGEDGLVSLLVDEIGDVIDVFGKDVELPSEMVSGVARDLICGVYKLPDKLLLMLDVDKTIAPDAA
jgi:purine-binding chemotaxis protein CheW